MSCHGKDADACLANGHLMLFPIGCMPATGPSRPPVAAQGEQWALAPLASDSQPSKACEPFVPTCRMRHPWAFDLFLESRDVAPNVSAPRGRNGERPNSRWLRSTGGPGRHVADPLAKRGSRGQSNQRAQAPDDGHVNDSWCLCASLPPELGRVQCH